MIKRLVGIQYLRAIAAIWVVIHHSGNFYSPGVYQPGLLHACAFGVYGVDVFFVLSGFIICHVHRGDIGDRRRVIGYLVNRLIRVFPPHWIALLIALPFYLKTAPYSRDAGLLAENVLLLPQHRAITWVTWTLSHELLFYLAFAVLILLGRAGWWLFAAWMGASALYLGQSAPAPFLLSPFNLEFGLGVLAAIAARRLPRAELLVLGGLAMALSLWLHMVAPEVVANWRVVYIGLPATMVAIGATAMQRIRAPLLLLGDASYALYLVHVPVLALGWALIAKAGLPTHPVLPLLLLPVVLLAGIQFHRRLEAPALRAARRLTRRSPTVES